MKKLMRDHFLITIRSVGLHESLANGKSSTRELKKLISGSPANLFKYRTMVQVSSFVPRTRFFLTSMYISRKDSGS